MNMSRGASWVAAGIVATGVAGGVTYAAVAAPVAGSRAQVGALDSALNDIATGPAAAGAADGRSRGRLGRRALLQRLDHGQLTLQAQGGTRTVDLQRGSVTSVSATSIAVTSLDGFARSYTVSGATKVRTSSGGQSGTAVHDGDNVLVIASAGNALRVIDWGH